MDTKGAATAAPFFLCGQPGDRFNASDGSRWRIVAIEASPAAAIGFDGLWTVEPLG